MEPGRVKGDRPAPARAADPVRDRAQLARLAESGGTVVAAIGRGGFERGWWRRERLWRQTYGWFDPEKSPYCTLLYETATSPQELCLVEVFRKRTECRSPAELSMPDEVLGCLRLSRFPWDRGLPTLPALLEDLGPAHVVRYRPRKRCTLCVPDEASGELRFAKLFADGRGEKIHAESVSLWQAASLGQLGFSVAEPGRWDAKTRTLWQGSVPGTPIRERLLGPSGHVLAGRIGRACASLTRASLQPSEELGPDIQLERTTRYARELARRVPALAADLQTLLADLERIHAGIGHRELKPIHGAPHPHQWLDTGSRLGLVDFDRLSLGDPELDAATFVAELDFEDRGQVPVDELNRAFLRGYESVAGPLDRRLLAAYRAHKRLAKAQKAARGVRLDAEGRATRNLRLARECLADWVH